MLDLAIKNSNFEILKNLYRLRNRKRAIILKLDLPGNGEDSIYSAVGFDSVGSGLISNLNENLIKELLAYANIYNALSYRKILTIP